VGVTAIGFSRRSAGDFSISTGTNVAQVSVVITHGTNHTFYYRGRLAWEWNQLCTRLGVGLRADSERRVSHSQQPADLLWLTFKHCDRVPKPEDIRGWEVKPGGGRRVYNGRGQISDKKRGVSVYHWPLSGGVEKHRGSTIHVEDKSNGEEFVSIQIR
jgi:hypothetical protein